jgi:capsid protein
MDMRNGTDSRQGIIAKRGRDAEVVDREISEDNDRADAMGLVYDSDPRHTSRSGVIQAAEKARIDRAVGGTGGGGGETDSGGNGGGNP